MVTMVRHTAQQEGADMAYWLTRHLMKMKWQDGTRVYCRACDTETPMTAVQTARGAMLECGSGHRTHPANVVVSKGME